MVLGGLVIVIAVGLPALYAQAVGGAGLIAGGILAVLARVTRPKRT